MAADSKGADFRDADMRCADFRDMDLQGADLRGADLRCADFTGANLWGADFRGADLRGAHLDKNNMHAIIESFRAGRAEKGVLRETHITGDIVELLLTLRETVGDDLTIL